MNHVLACQAQRKGEFALGSNRLIVAFRRTSIQGEKQQHPVCCPILCWRISWEGRSGADNRLCTCPDCWKAFLQETSGKRAVTVSTRIWTKCRLGEKRIATEKKYHQTCSCKRSLRLGRKREDSSRGSTIHGCEPVENVQTNILLLSSLGYP